MAALRDNTKSETHQEVTHDPYEDQLSPSEVKKRGRILADLLLPADCHQTPMSQEQLRNFFRERLAASETPLSERKKIIRSATADVFLYMIRKYSHDDSPKSIEIWNRVKTLFEVDSDHREAISHGFFDALSRTKNPVQLVHYRGKQRNLSRLWVPVLNELASDHLISKGGEEAKLEALIHPDTPPMLAHSVIGMWNISERSSSIIQSALQSLFEKISDQYIVTHPLHTPPETGLKKIYPQLHATLLTEIEFSMFIASVCKSLRRSNDTALTPDPAWNDIILKIRSNLEIHTRGVNLRNSKFLEQHELESYDTLISHLEDIGELLPPKLSDGLETENQIRYMKQLIATHLQKE